MNRGSPCQITVVLSNTFEVLFYDAAWLLILLICLILCLAQMQLAPGPMVEFSSINEVAGKNYIGTEFQ